MSVYVLEALYEKTVFEDASCYAVFDTLPVMASSDYDELEAYANGEFAESGELAGRKNGYRLAKWRIFDVPFLEVER